jgi:TusA-related sulfurtransferase
MDRALSSRGRRNVRDHDGNNGPQEDLKCPLPALETRKLLSRMAASDVLECSDLIVDMDVPSLLTSTGSNPRRAGHSRSSSSRAVATRFFRLSIDVPDVPN